MKKELKNLIKSIVAKKNKIKFSQCFTTFLQANQEKRKMFALLEYDLKRVLKNLIDQMKIINGS